MQETQQGANLLTVYTSTLPEQGKEVVAKWLKGLTPVTCIKPGLSMFVVVSKDEQGAYHVTAFFPLGGHWTASSDAQGVSADEAFQALAHRLN